MYSLGWEQASSYIQSLCLNQFTLQVEDTENTKRLLNHEFTDGNKKVCTVMYRNTT